MTGGVVTAAIVALGGVLVAIVNRGGSKTTPSPPAPSGAGSSDHVLYERTAVHNRRLDDADERFDLMDRARAQDRNDLDEVLDYLNTEHPGWRD